MCLSSGDMVDHFLIHCDVAYDLWSLVFRTFGIRWVLPRYVADLLFGWRNWFGRQTLEIWYVILLCLM